MKTSAEIRQAFLDFYAERGHSIVKSSSLIPGNDPTLLFTNAGMVQFKDVFTGMETRPYSRAVTAQKCMRVSGKHNDLESVGPSPRHHTLFEMLGNFSFGDYFKREAITWAWDFMTRVMELPVDRLWPTIYVDDDEAMELWKEIAGLPEERITRLGKKDNFWEMGDTGPCGPSSELIYDRGPEACTCGRPDCNLAIECDRWLELGNLVFTQYEQRANGELVPLPNPNIDTGFGLERIVSVKQDATNNYDTDLFLPVMERTRELLGKSEEEMRADIVPYRVIADHSRALTFLIADGIMPGNEGRSYVLRMILRRAARFGRKLGFEEPFLAETAQAVIDVMGEHYTEIVDRAQFVKDVITQEEKRFLTTLSTGLNRLDQLAEQLKAEGTTVVPGDEAFRLYDTYGFPIELTRDAAVELGLQIDEEGFVAAMEAQRERARSAQRFQADDAADVYRQLDLPRSEFLGYESTDAEATVLAMVIDGQAVQQASEGDQVDVVLDRTPFYGESGGQVGDQGTLKSQTAELAVGNTTHPVPDLVTHHASVTRGTLSVGDTVGAQVDVERRLDIARNHTATHLLHRALRTVLGDHAAQSGSLVTPDRLRFDFSHLQPMTPVEIAQVEAWVNAEIRANHSVSTSVKSYEDATRDGAIALFGEKYGDSVRAVEIADCTTELCGGTHLRATGQIGSFLVVSESSVGSGLRRIEALTGRGAYRHLREKLDSFAALGSALGGRPGQEMDRLEALNEELRQARRTIHELQQAVANASTQDLTSQVTDVNGIPVLAQVVNALDVDTLRDMADAFRDKLGSAVVALGAICNERPMLVVGLTPDMVKQGLHAGKLAGAAARKMGGGGGGRPNMATAGGKQADKLQEAVDAIAQLVAESVQ